MTVVCLALAIVFTPFRAQVWGGRTAAASAAFVSNWYLWWSGGSYFGPGDEQNPFLHTWSLSIEEQFYFFAPLLLAAGHRWRSRRGGLITFGAVTATSFALSGVLLNPHVAENLAFDDLSRFVFFGLPTRLWELSLGVLLALGALRPAVRVRHAVAIAGLLTILGTAMLIDGTTTFPGPAALLPTLGTIALLATPDSIVARFASWRPLVAVGDLSYSWYLWHWPLMVLARAAAPDHRDVAGVVAAVIALLPAIASRHLIEEPFRRNDGIVGRRIVAVAALCTVPPILIGLGVSIGGKDRWGIEMPEAWRDRRLAVTTGCVDMEGPFPKECIFGDAIDGRTVLLIGDSHAASLTEGVRDAAQAAGMGLAVWAMSGCPSLLGRSTVGKPPCKQRQSDWL